MTMILCWLTESVMQWTKVLGASMLSVILPSPFQISKVENAFHEIKMTQLLID